MANRDEWVRVKSERELRAGMCVELRRCRHCGRDHRMIISRVVLDERPCPEGRSIGYTRKEIGGCQDYVDHCWCKCIDEGRLYRLADSQLTESETTRELERVQ
jgi:hypothetical protein